MTHNPGLTVEIGWDSTRLCSREDYIDGRPCVETHGGDYWILRDDIHYWLVEKRVAYELEFNRFGERSNRYKWRWDVRISDVKIGLLFKLTFA